MLKFKQRKSTDAIIVVEKNIANASVNDLRAEAKRLGDFDIGYHLIVYQDGALGYGREMTAPAGHDLPHCDTSLYVLVDVGNEGKISDAQKKALKYIQKMQPNAQLMRLTTGIEDLEV